MTLTTKRQLDSLGLSRAVGEWQHRLNKKLFGTAYSRRGVARLATYAVQELNYNQGIHTHLIVGIPEGALQLRPNRCRLPFEQQAIETWCGLDYAALPAAQDVRPVTDLMGLVGYTHKTIKDLKGVDNIDVMNLHIPEMPPTVPTSAG